ncbi:uncharacterized protein PV06_08726 [Exophiala oligosperma]|uniref:Uncharacterized protein n=1 Tax=Exophiala oligosperma TaxID=215243 RepID=A0A0D2BN30_9EURO|nr:uncharacterized protein PV06_08726 [Exophiala oligosperma]KIW38902.1 hypothetical protein PV06_08726 [Exophiala oligosperma]
MAAVSQIGDGQVQGGMHTVVMSVPVAVSEIGDGQVQAPTVTATTTDCESNEKTSTTATRIMTNSGSTGTANARSNQTTDSTRTSMWHFGSSYQSKHVDSAFTFTFTNIFDIDLVFIYAHTTSRTNNPFVTGLMPDKLYFATQSE